MHILIAHGRSLYESVGKKLLRVLRVTVVHLSLSNFNTETRRSRRLHWEIRFFRHSFTWQADDPGTALLQISCGHRAACIFLGSSICVKTYSRAIRLPKAARELLWLNFVLTLFAAF